MKYVIWTMVLILLIAHQDNWNWYDDTLVWGVVPIGLFYHACISLAAGFTWWLATLFMWPKELDVIAEPALVDATDATAQENN